MTHETLLLRQIHPSFVQGGVVTSQAFRPTPKDDDLLSVDDGDRISAPAAWDRHTGEFGCRSDGVMAVTVAECATLDLPVAADGEPYPEHASVVFAGLTGGQRDRAAKKLRYWATDRGWLYQAPSS